jgi:uncharacterized membrane protein
MGLFIPAWSGRRVVYGHPFETVDAQRTKASVEGFFSAGARPDAHKFMLNWNVAFMFVGPREHALGFSAVPSEAAVFRNATVTIYQENP